MWIERDKNTFVQVAMSRLKTARMMAPIRSVAARWFSLMDDLAESSGDVWLHRQGNEFW